MAKVDLDSVAMRLAIVLRWSKFVARAGTRKPQEGNAVKRTVLALVIAAMAMPAYAQFNPLAGGTRVNPKTDAEVKQERDREAGYRSGVGKIPDGKGNSDPWAGVRSAAPSQNQSRPNAK
jgi:hypothetical protein